MKILVTGGHIAPALACIDYLQKHTDDSVVFVGRKYNNDWEKTESLEYKEIQDRKIPFYPLTAGRVTRSLSLHTLRNLMLIPVGFISSVIILLKVRPDAILSFGGYVALPICIVGKLFGTKVYTHEQTINPGLANKIIGAVADKVFVSFSETARHFSKNKTLVTGNPVREQIFEHEKLPFTIDQKKPMIYVTGGSLGSHNINVHIQNILEKLLEEYTVVHQCGNVSEYQDFQTLTELKSTLKNKERYILREHISSEEIGSIYHEAALVISRAGANTVFELIALKKPSILIPLSISAFGEQQKHAELLESAKVAEIFNEGQSSKELLELIHQMATKLNSYRNNFASLTTIYTQNAAQSIVKEIIQR